MSSAPYALLYVVPLYFLVFSVPFFFRRKTLFLFHRHAILVLMSAFFMTLTCELLLIPLALGERYCVAARWGIYTAAPLFEWTWALRLLMLIFDAQANLLKADILHNRRKMNAFDRLALNVRGRHRRPIVVFLLVALVFHAVLGYVFESTKNPNTLGLPQGSCFAQSALFEFVFNLFQASISVALVFLVLFLRVNDPYLIKFELLASILLLIPALVTLSVWFFTPERLSFNGHAMWLFLFFPGLLASLLAPLLATTERALPLVLWMTQKSSFGRHGGRSSSAAYTSVATGLGPARATGELLDRLIASEPAFADLTRYAQKQWCVENLLFLKEYKVQKQQKV